LNIELQKVFNDINKPFISRGGYDYREGDKIIQNGNNYEAKTIPKFGEEEYGQTEIFNGTLGKIEKVIIEDTEKGKVQRVHIKFEDEDDIVEYSSDEMGQIGLAYALTVHKCVTPDTMVVTNKGIMKIENAIKNNRLTIHNGRDMEKPSNSVIYKNEKTIRVKTKRGFELEGTTDHRINILDERGNLVPKTLSEVKQGDIVAIRKSAKIFGTDYVNLKSY